MKRTKLKKGSAVEVGSSVKVTRPSGAEFEGKVENLTDTSIKLDTGRRFRLANVTVEPAEGGSSTTRTTSRKKTARSTTSRGTKAATGAKGGNGRRTARKTTRATKQVNGDGNPFKQEMEDLTWYSSVYEELEGSLELLRNRDLKGLNKVLQNVIKSIQQ